MAAFVAKQERRLLEAARKEGKEDRYWDDLTAALDKKELKSTDFSIRECFEAFVDDGREIVDSWNPRHRSGRAGHGIQLMEAGVDTGNFANITGQIVYTMVMDVFNSPAFISGQLMATVPTQFNGEKIPGIGQIGDEAESIGEGKPYPMAGVSEEWIETPQTTKRGFIVPVTKEAVFFDRTGLVLNRASDVSTWLAVNKEKRCLDVILGITSLYIRNGIGPIATYGDNSGNHDWDNLQAANALVDWTDVENAKLLFDGLTDPITGEPIVVMPDSIIVPSALEWTADRILSATEVRHGDGAGGTYSTIGGNPIKRRPSVYSNAWVSTRTGSSSTWFYGEPRGAFMYMENWPISAVAAPSNSELEFTHDIVARWKVSERGAAAVKEPRKMTKSTA